MALIFLFVLASVLLFVKVAATGLTLGAALAIGSFVVLASGVFVGAFLESRRWEAE